MADKIGTGDFVRVEFTGRRAAGGAVFDTTDAAKAKEAGIFNERYKYGPSLVVVGKGMVVKGMDEALAGMSVGESRKLELQPEQAFGLRMPSLIRVIPLSEFRKRDVSPQPGMMIELDGNPAMVKSVTSGRVMVDMNHTLAGDKILYDVKVTEKLEGMDKKVRAILQENGLEPGAVKATADAAEIAFKPESGGEARHFVAKTAFLRAAKELLPELKKVRFDEEFTLSETKDAKKE